MTAAGVISVVILGIMAGLLFFALAVGLENLLSRKDKD